MTAAKKRENIKKWVYDEIICAIRTCDFDHIDRKHINKSANFLKERISAEQKDIATSFCGNPKKIHNTIVNSIKSDRELIVYWLSKNEKMIELEYPIPEGICGYGFQKSGSHDWKSGSLPCEYFRVVLQKQSEGEDGAFRIVTAYPVF